MDFRGVTKIRSSCSRAGSISAQTVNAVLLSSAGSDQAPVRLRLGDRIDMMKMMVSHIPLKIQHKTRRSRSFQDHKKGISIVYCAHVQTSMQGSDQWKKSSTLYHVLGLTFGVTREEIKASYQRLARLHHPDSAPPDGKDKSAQDFMDIHTEYTTLSNPHSRADYDRLHIICMKNRWRARSWETGQCWWWQWIINQHCSIESAISSCENLLLFRD